MEPERKQQAGRTWRSISRVYFASAQDSSFHNLPARCLSCYVLSASQVRSPP